MIYSMTAFARAEIQNETATLTCELRSTNHRFLEISLHIPESFRAFEMAIRERIRAHAKRGKIDCTLRYQINKEAAQSSFSLNLPLATELCKASETVASLMPHAAPTNAADILRFPGVIETKQTDISHLQEQALAVVDKATQELMLARGREGKELEKIFLSRLALMDTELQKVKMRLPNVMQDARNRLTARFNEAKIELDPTRLEQELVFFAQKIDIAEEIDRATTHISEFRRALSQDELVGRRLDFLLQEMNREANTLGSKSVDTVLTHAAVEMKVLIEQVREQVQNVE